MDFEEFGGFDYNAYQFMKGNDTAPISLTYQVIESPSGNSPPIIFIKSHRWIYKHGKDLALWCKENNIKWRGLDDQPTEIHCNDEGDVVMFKLRWEGVE